jgi:hypothetical protein
MRPMPGQPSGKLEKSLCSGIASSLHKNVPARRLASLAANWIPRSGGFLCFLQPSVPSGGGD